MVGRILASPEKRSYELMEYLGVKYVLVFFGKFHIFHLLQKLFNLNEFFTFGKYICSGHCLWLEYRLYSVTVGNFQVFLKQKEMTRLLICAGG